MAKAKTLKPENDPRVPSGSRRSLKDMSESHRAHVLFWEPFYEALRAEFVWIAVSRYPERGGEGKHYVAVKRGDKDYAIIDFDTSKPTKITKRNVLDDGFTSSTAMLETFKTYRQMARDERAKATKPTKPKTVRKTGASKPKKPPAKPAARKPAARTRKPAAAKK